MIDGSLLRLFGILLFRTMTSLLEGASTRTCSSATTNRRLLLLVVISFQPLFSLESQA